MTVKESAAARMAANLEAEEASQELIDQIHVDAATHAGASHLAAYGSVGRPFNRRAPFLVGFTAALGAACAFAIAWMVVLAGQVLVLLALAFCLAVGLEPAVVALYRRGLPRWAALSVVLVSALGMCVGF